MWTLPSTVLLVMTQPVGWPPFVVTAVTRDDSSSLLGSRFSRCSIAACATFWSTPSITCSINWHSIAFIEPGPCFANTVSMFTGAKSVSKRGIDLRKQIFILNWNSDWRSMHEVCNGTIPWKEVRQKPEYLTYPWKMHVVTVEKRNKLWIYFLLTYEHNLLILLKTN